jgi:hypothetical protein
VDTESISWIAKSNKLAKLRTNEFSATHYFFASTYRNESATVSITHRLISAVIHAKKIKTAARCLSQSAGLWLNRRIKNFLPLFVLQICLWI